jgi:hypothetical protein
MFRTIGSTFAHRFAATVIAAALVSSLAAIGCSSSSNGTTPPDSGSTTCDLAGLEALFTAKQCTLSGCHDSAAGSAGLDLKSAGLADRLLGKGPVAGVGSVPSSCAGLGKIYLLASRNPSMGLLIDKLTGNPGCGVRMPLGGSPLTTSQMECVRSWALTVTSP